MREFLHTFLVTTVFAATTYMTGKLVSYLRLRLSTALHVVRAFPNLSTKLQAKIAVKVIRDSERKEN